MDNKILQTAQINLYNCNIESISSENFIRSFLKKLVDFIGMNRIPSKFVKSKNPLSFDFKSEAAKRDPKESGVTGLIILYESHCAIHTWPSDEYNRFACVVISSCKEYDAEATFDFCKKQLGATDGSWKEVKM